MNEVTTEKTVNKRTTDFPIPQGGLRTCEPSGYDWQVHAKLRAADFADVLDFALWESSYFLSKSEACKRRAESLRSLGANAEERAAVLAFQSKAEALEKELAKIMLVNSALVGRMSGVVGNILASMKTQS